MRSLLVLCAALSLAVCLATPQVAAQVAADAAAEDAALLAGIGLDESSAPVRDFPGWRPPTTIVALNFRPDTQAWLRSAAPGARIIVVESAQEALPVMQDADVLIGMCTAELVEAAPKLRWIQSASVGVESCVAIPRVRAGDILLTNMQRIPAPIMAEHVVAMLLGLARGFPAYLPAQHEGRWLRPEQAERPVALRTIEGKTLLVVGLGGIGVEVARRAHALGMIVIATRASDRPGPPYVSKVGKPDDLLRFAAEADAVVAALPLTDATRHLFDATFFSAMRPTAYFINVGRGESVVTDDLLAALRTGRIGGAGLDVTDPEPLPPDHPLWRAPNLVITPHVSARSDADRVAHHALYRENLRRYASGEKLLSVVDAKQGY